MLAGKLIRVVITVDPGNGYGLATGDEEEGDSAGAEGVHQLEKHNTPLKHGQKQKQFPRVCMGMWQKHGQAFLSSHLRHEREPQ